MKEINEAMAKLEEMMKRMETLKSEATKEPKKKQIPNGHCEAKMIVTETGIVVEANIGGTKEQLFALLGSIFDNMNDGNGSKNLAEFTAEYLMQKTLEDIKDD